jgi:hypothetical protein
MLKIVFCLLFISLGLICCQQQHQCLTTNEADSPDRNAVCVFPFFFRKKMRNNCINDTDPDSRFWCSTRTDPSGNHIGGLGNWGFCQSDCL